MIDFTHCEVNKFRAYGGANGNKINVRYQGEGYMLKFSPCSHPEQNHQLHQQLYQRIPVLPYFRAAWDQGAGNPFRNLYGSAGPREAGGGL